MPKARSGDFEPAHQIHCVSTASVIQQQRRIQSLKRKLDKDHLVQALTLEWRKILRFAFKGRSFVCGCVTILSSYRRHGTCRTYPGYMILINCGNMKFILLCVLIARSSLLGATPKLESIEHNVEQAAILIPLARWVSAKAPERLEAFVEDVSAFQVGQAVMLDHQPGWSREIREHSMIVSCSEALPDTEQGQQPALIAIS